jgi:long-chain-alcohol oxidase
VIVGSGCGGGIMAEQLVNAGYNVLVLEKGGYYQPSEFTKWRECEAMSKLYEKGGLCASDDGSIVILAGSTIGGGSTVNWTASFKTPEHVLSDWKENYHLPWFNKDGEFQQSLQYVLSRMNVNTDNSYFDVEEAAKGEADKAGTAGEGAVNIPSFTMNENNRLFWKSSEKLGFQPEKIPRNVKNCIDCGHCGFGCSYKSKQSTCNAILEPILLSQHKETKDVKTPAKADSTTTTTKKGKLYIIPDCNVSQVITTINPENPKRKTALGIKATVSIYEKGLGKASLDRILLKTRSLIVDSKITICSAGSLHTPALLLRSHFEHRLIGKNLTLHPVLGVAGIFPSSIKPGLDKGVGMGVVVREPSVNASNHCEKDEDKEYCRNHPIALETPPIHLGLCF